MARDIDRPAVEQPKHPFTRLSGPYGHPFHPLLVTVPIGAWVASLVFDIASRIVDSSEAGAWAQGAYWLVAIGVIGALAAAVFGLLDLLGIPRKTKALRNGLWHLGLNLTVVALFVVSFFLRRADETYESATPIGIIILSVVTLAILAVSGWLGGRLTYRYGVRVADQRDQVQGYQSGQPSVPHAA